MVIFAKFTLINAIKNKRGGVMKRFFITISLILGCALLFCVGLGVILALAPGSRIFGIEYVSAQIGKADIVKEWSEYVEGDIYINTKDIPVNINFEPYGTTKVEFIQHYSGYTTGGYRVPSAEIEKNGRGITISTNEIERFLIGKNHKYALNVTLPASWGTSGRHSVYVNGKSSKINLNADENNCGTLKFVELSLNSKNDVNLNCKLDVRNLNIYSSKSLVLDENLMAQNITFESHSGNLSVKYNVLGNLNVKTVSGDVKFLSCNNANIETSGGKVSGLEGGCIISGKTNIKTRSGSVSIQNMAGLGEENVVTTNAGSINIETMLSGKIASPRGKINIKTLSNAEIIGGTNTITLGSVYGTATISSKRGTVNVGSLGEKCTVNNLTVSTSSGNINAYNTKGEINLTTKNGNVKLHNSQSSKITINSGKEVVATGLRGEVNISANGEMNLGFSNFNANTQIKGNKKCEKINISIENKTEEQLNYNITTTKKGVAKVYSGNVCIKEGLSVATSEPKDTLKTLTVDATSCNINVYLKAK